MVYRIDFFSIGAISPVVDLHHGKKSLEVDQLTLASGGSGHAYIVIFSIAISWGNKLNFSSYANMASFCSDRHICKYISSV